MFFYLDNYCIFFTEAKDLNNSISISISINRLLAAMNSKL